MSMSPKQAVEVLDKYTLNLNYPRQVHLEIIEALKTLGSLVDEVHPKLVK